MTGYKSITQRGFGFTQFSYADYRGEPEDKVFSVQESSLASEHKVWIGCSSHGEIAHLNEDQARLVRDALNEFLGEHEPDTTGDAPSDLELAREEFYRLEREEQDALALAHTLGAARGDAARRVQELGGKL